VTGKGSRTLLGFGGAMALALGVAAVGLGSPIRVAAAPGDHVLTGQVVSVIATSTLLGDVPAATPMIVGVSLTPADAAGEEAAAAAINDRTSPQYHHFFTPATWQARFVLPQSVSDPVVQRYIAAGLQVVYSSPTRDYFDFSGTAAQVDQAFSSPSLNIHLSQYRGASGGTFFANAAPPTVPAAVNAVTGLSDLAAHTHHQTNCVNNVCVGTLQYTDLWSVYDLPPAFTGLGQKIAIIGNGSTAGPTFDLHKFETENGLPQVPTVCHAVAGNTCTGSTNANEGEWALDSESSTSMAPGVSELDYYFSTNLGDTAAFSAWSNDPNGPNQANASFGGCESLNAALGSIAADSPVFAQDAAEGRTLFVSTGDTGGSCTVITGNGIVNTIAPQVEWPAASHWNVAVGGTVLYTDNMGHRATLPSGPAEIAWSHTGGGTSITQTKPPWQQSIQVIVGQCILDEGGSPLATPVPCRGLPDVAAMSGDITVNAGGDAFADVEGGTDSGAGNDTADGGTSLSSPLWCGMWTRTQSADGGNLGFAVPLLYGIGLTPAKDVVDFYDVTQGSNGQFTALARNNVAPPDPSGWDYVSGFGTPDIGKLIADLATVQPPPPPGVPESPAAPLLVVVPLGVAAALWLARRRRWSTRRT
jgi:pseudomonalisin